MKVKSDLSVEIQFSSTKQLKKKKKKEQINWQGVLSQSNSFLSPLFGYPFFHMDSIQPWETAYMTRKKKNPPKLVSKQIGKYPQQRPISMFNDAYAPLIKQEFKGSQVPLNSTICSRQGREEHVLSAALHTRTLTHTSLPPP